MLSSGLRCTAFAKSFAALDGFDLFTIHNLSSNEMAEPGLEPGAAGCEARTLSIVLHCAMRPPWLHVAQIQSSNGNWCNQQGTTAGLGMMLRLSPNRQYGFKTGDKSGIKTGVTSLLPFDLLEIVQRKHSK